MTYYEAYNEAIEQKPCDDVVSRRAVKEQMIKYGFHAPDMTVKEFVEDLQPAPQPTYYPLCKDCNKKMDEIRRIYDKIKDQEPSRRDIKEIEEVINCDADAKTKCKMISNILTAKPHYFEKQETCDDRSDE